MGRLAPVGLAARVDGADAGPVRRSSVREIVTGNNLIEGVMRDPSDRGSTVPSGARLRDGLACDGGLRPRPRRWSLGRIPGLRLLFDAVARKRRGHLRVLQQNLWWCLAPGLESRARAPASRSANGSNHSALRGTGRSLYRCKGRLGGTTTSRQPRSRITFSWIMTAPPGQR